MNRLTDLAAAVLLIAAAVLAPPLLAATDDRRQPVTIEADGAVFDEQKGQSVYTGHVVITQAGMQIRADRVTVYTEDDELSRIVAEGEPVRFRERREGEKEILGEARRLDYRVTEQRETLLLLDQAWLSQGGNRFSGQRIEYDMDSERIQAAQGKDGSQRVRVTIVPKSKDKAKAEPADTPGAGR